MQKIDMKIPKAKLLLFNIGFELMYRLVCPMSIFLLFFFLGRNTKSIHYFNKITKLLLYCHNF